MSGDRADSVEPAEGRGYWDEDPDYPSVDWMYQVVNGHTRRGYWEWVSSENGASDS